MKGKSDIKIDIKSAGFPSHFVSDKEKETPEFGLQIGQAIQYDWFRMDGSRAKFYSRWAEIHKLRLYARGEQPIQKYKNELAIDGDLSWLNIDWTPVPVMPKFVDIVVNGMADREMKIKTYAQDAISQTKRMKFQDMIEGQSAAKDVLTIVKEKTGVNPFVVDPTNLPSNDEELALYMQLKYKPAIEIAEQEAISAILSENRYEEKLRRFNYDLVTIGQGAIKHDFMKPVGVSVEYVDPANIVHSYTDDPYFRDIFYVGEIKTIPINDVLKIDQSITKDELKEISEYSGAWFNYFNLSQYYNSSFAQDTATLLYFNYKTTKKFVYKKKKNDSGLIRMIEKDDSFEPPQEMIEDGKFEKVEKIIDVWYNGIMVMGSNKLLRWELMSNMVRPKSSSQHAICNYIITAPRMYKGVIESLGRRMIPFVDQIQLNHLKLQQVSSRIVPDGIYLDADGVNEVDLGNGATYSPQEAIRMYFQTGSVIGRSYTVDGEYNHGKIPVQELNTQAGANKIAMLIESYNHNMQMLRDCTGLNEARDASMPDPKSLVGLQKLAAMNSNTATRHILDANMFITKSLAEAVTYRISDILEYSDSRDDFANKIGKYNLAILEEIKDLYLYDFGIFIEIAPDEEEKAALEANIQMALSKNDINLEDAIDIRDIKNIKMANQLLKLKRIKKLERDERMAMEQQAIVAQQNLKSQEMAAQAAMQKIQLETNSKIQIKQAETQFDVQKLNAEAELKLKLMREEFRYNMQLKGLEAQSLMTRESEKEDRKDKRISKQSTEQSKLIAQRQNNLPPVDFESNEDTLDGFGLESFEPR